MLIVIAFFALAWFPLQHLTGKSASPEDTPVQNQYGNKQAGKGFTVRIMSSHPLKTLSLNYIDQPLLIIEEPDVELESEHTITGMSIPEAEIEFWVEAALKSAPGENQRAAIHLELIPEDLEKSSTAVTVWGQPGESRIETNALLLFPASSK